MLLGVPRFDGWFGRLGIDAEYARGAQLVALQRREFDRFTSAWRRWRCLAIPTPSSARDRDRPFHTRRVSIACERSASRARAPTRTPCSAGTGVMLQYLRLLLACESATKTICPPARCGWARRHRLRGLPPGPASAAIAYRPQGSLSYRCRSDGRRAIYEVSRFNHPHRGILRTWGPARLEDPGGVSARRDCDRARSRRVARSVTLIS